MQKSAIVLLVVLLSGLNANAAAPPAKVSSSAAALTVDLGKACPPEIELQVGQSLVFQNGLAKVQEKSAGAKLLVSRPHNTFNQVAAFRAERAGVTEIVVTKGGVSSSIKVTVAVPDPVTLSIDPSKLPAKIELVVGQRVSFIGTDYTVDVSYKATDGKKAELLEKWKMMVHMVPGHYFHGLYTARREGEGTFVFAWYRNGKKVGETLVPLTVKAIPVLKSVSLLVEWTADIKVDEVSRALAPLQVQHVERVSNRRPVFKVKLYSTKTADELVKTIKALPGVKKVEPSSWFK